MAPGSTSRITPRLLAGALLAGVAAVLALVLLIGWLGDRDGDRRISVIAPSAQFFIPGLRVNAAGQEVGRVTEAEVTDDDQARVELRIDNDDVWPLPQGTQVRLRWAGTVKMSGRYVELTPPEAEDAPPIPNGGLIPASDVTTPSDYVTSPQEFDEIFGILDSTHRGKLKEMLDRGGPALIAAADELRRTLDSAPPALTEAEALMEDLGADRDSLSTLVRSSDRVVEVINSANPDLAQLLSGAGTTFDAVARESRDLELTLERMPGTLRSVRRTLSRADGTLLATADLSRRLSPGVGEVRRLAKPLAGVLGSLVDVGPDARGTLSTLRQAVPDLNPFLTWARRLMPDIGSIGEQAAGQLRCIRPFAPEIAAFFVNWTGIWGGADPTDHFLRTGAGTFPWPNGVPLTAGELSDLYPGVTSSFPRPPGQTAGQPWFQPECGMTADSIDPSKDPEAMGVDPLGRELIQFGDDPEGWR